MSRLTGGRYRAPRGVFFGRGGFRRPLDDIEDDENNDSPSFDGYGLQQHRYVNPDEQDEEDEEEVDEVEETEEDDEYEEEAEEEEDEEVSLTKMSKKFYPSKSSHCEYPSQYLVKNTHKTKSI
jgi:hypothetical protein